MSACGPFLVFQQSCSSVLSLNFCLSFFSPFCLLLVALFSQPLELELVIALRMSLISVGQPGFGLSPWPVGLPFRKGYGLSQVGLLKLNHTLFWRQEGKRYPHLQNFPWCGRQQLCGRP